MRGLIALAVVSLTASLSFATYSLPSSASEHIQAAFHNMPHSPIPGLVQRAGLWDKPNQACITKCEAFVKKGCFRTLAEKNPAADPAALQDQCDDKFSLCLYDCMCDTCDENQIIIKQP